MNCRPVARIRDITDYGSLIVEVDQATFNDLLDCAINRSYGNGYEDGSQDNIRAE